MKALESDDAVNVLQDRWIHFQPAGKDHRIGLILYPGGHVDARAYAPLARAISEKGFLVVIVPMPLNLAVFGSEKADQVIIAYPEIESWVIGGHSLGGVMAARFAARRSEVLQGLVLWASYPGVNDDLRESGLKVVSIYGTRDGLTTRADVQASQQRLPADTTWVEIDGGNHAQFGQYGAQAGDLEPLISVESQHTQIIDATLALLSMLMDD